MRLGLLQLFYRVWSTVDLELNDVDVHVLGSGVFLVAVMYPSCLHVCVCGCGQASMLALAAQQVDKPHCDSSMHCTHTDDICCKWYGLQSFNSCIWSGQASPCMHWLQSS